MTDNVTTDNKRSIAADQWTSLQAYTLAVVCLAVGILGGWFVRGSQAPAEQPSSIATPSTAQPSAATASQPSAEEMRRMADKQAEPLLAKLQGSPNDPELLASVGNVYYDAQQFPVAIEYYQRSLKLKSADASVRTDMATAYWYVGSADTAIVEFNKALADEPNKANALFNLGVVQWQGKMNVEAALATWQKLLETNPNYDNKDKLLELMAQVKKHAGLKPSTQAKALAD
jgi:cytochrome c-type biogenesis protein CcmH/NrfG